MNDVLSVAEQRCWVAATPLAPMASNPIPIYCDAVNAYHDSIYADGDTAVSLLRIETGVYAELTNWRTRTLVDSGFWEQDYDFADDSEHPAKEESDEPFEMLIPDLDYDGDFDD